MAARSTRPGAFLTEKEKKLVEAAIASAESGTSGEIRVMVSLKVTGDALKAAQESFFRLNMEKTALRNGILILLAVKSRAFAIVGDEGIHRIVGQEGWDSLRDKMAEYFKKDDFGGGLAWAVGEVGKVLGQHFPHEKGDLNELSDEVVEE